ncbi:MAG: tRNA pseudouridine(38-40) synthase TruA [Deltaproteobacteria bacterium]|nr:tRNA pseudouridine(38-40) synthase TruA [Deltaproteobacteria bacterium]
MRNIKLQIEYDGTAYVGWQIQNNGKSVQGVLQNALKKMTGDDVNLIGCGRTDSGVHAIDYTANFNTNSGISTDGFFKGLNTSIPYDIVIKSAEEVESEFNARRSAKAKTYIYRVLIAHHRPAIYRERCWQINQELDLEVMKEGAALLVGEKDFKTFCAIGSNATEFVREVSSFIITERDEGFIDFSVRGRSFLMHMVRIMVGSLVMLGRGKLTLDEFGSAIEAKDRMRLPYTAPSQGLFLRDVEY